MMTWLTPTQARPRPARLAALRFASAMLISAPGSWQSSGQLTVPRLESPVIAPTEVEVRRLITYVESAPIAKDAEEELLYKDMQAELARQILRRIAASKREM